MIKTGKGSVMCVWGGCVRDFEVVSFVQNSNTLVKLMTTILQNKQLHSNLSFSRSL